MSKDHALKKGFDGSNWIPIDEAEDLLVYEINREYDRVHCVRIDGDSGHYYPDRARMNPPEDYLDDIEIWIYNETDESSAGIIVEPHFHVCKGQTEVNGAHRFEIDIEVEIRNIGQLNIWHSVTRHMSWDGLDELYRAVKKWLNEKAYDTEITNKEAIRLEWNRNNLSNRVDKGEL